MWPWMEKRRGSRRTLLSIMQIYTLSCSHSHRPTVDAMILTLSDEEEEHLERGFNGGGIETPIKG